MRASGGIAAATATRLELLKVVSGLLSVLMTTLGVAEGDAFAFMKEKAKVREQIGFYLI